MPKYFRGADKPRIGDLAYTEIAMFDEVAPRDLYDGHTSSRARQGLPPGVPVDQLAINGVKHIFACQVKVIRRPRCLMIATSHNRSRQEGGRHDGRGAVGKATGMPGVCFVTRGPGATNASIGIHIARQDSTPLIMFVGQVKREFKEREAFQELDYRAVFGSMAKWATEIEDPARVPEIVSRAFYVATSGRPGPVVVALPEDMLSEQISVSNAPPLDPVETWPGSGDV
jgi:acetolactate synthase-1/2/3 large subunit